ncbi:MAG: PorT family protein [Bacteroidia bacterium]|nr:PorT family protein [Bacteroidia bacterium]
MKKILAIAVLVTGLTAAQAQEGFRIGAKGSFYSTWLFNKNVSDQNSSLDYASTFSPNFGIQAIYMLKETYGISAEVVYSMHNQKYDGFLNNDDNVFNLETKLSYLDIPILFRVSSPKGPYFEIGPQFSLLMGAKETVEYEKSAMSDEAYDNKDFKDDFASFGVAGVLGFGIDIKLADNINLTTGLRFGYMFTDATTEYSEEELVEKDQNDVDISGATYFAHMSAEHSLGDARNDLDYKKTARAFGGFQLGIQFMLD